MPIPLQIATDAGHCEAAHDRALRRAAGADATVFLIDDDCDVLSALTPRLRSEGLEIRAFDCARAFLSQHDPATPGCVVMDVVLPDCSGLEVQQQLGRDDIQRPVIFLTGIADVRTSVQAMKAGAVDFLVKPVDTAQLMAAVRSALRQDAAARQARQDCAALDQKLVRLTPREREILPRIIAGRLNKQIAVELGIVEKTVKVHRGRLMAKLGVRGIVGLMRLSLRARLLPELSRAMPQVGPWPNRAASWREITRTITPQEIAK